MPADDQPPCAEEFGSCSDGNCVFDNLRDGTKCGASEASRCCHGACRSIDSDSSNCGGCDFVCQGRCTDAASPSGCGPDIDVSGRCACSSDNDCPPSTECLLGVCAPTRCKARQTLARVSTTCPSYCFYR
ncbi:MAG: hypothetical protein AMXMBFR34_31650 [Myxococcaceae bacterium]